MWTYGPHCPTCGVNSKRDRARDVEHWLIRQRFDTPWSVPLFPAREASCGHLQARRV